MERAPTLEEWVHPTLGYQLRMSLPGTPFWAQFIPLAAAAVALVPYWWLRRRGWDWESELPRLTLAAALTACYGAWGSDLVILLLPVLQAAVWLLAIGSRPLTALMAAAFAAGNGLLLASLREPGSQANPWITPAVLTAYLIVALWPPGPIRAPERLLQ